MVKKKENKLTEAQRKKQSSINFGKRMADFEPTRIGTKTNPTKRKK